MLHEAQSQPWSAGATKALVLIGDDVPHPPAHNPGRLDWRQEADALTEDGRRRLRRAGAGPRRTRRSSTRSWPATRAASTSRSTSSATSPTWSWRSATGSPARSNCSAYEEEVKTQGRMSRGLDRIFSTMLGRAETPTFAAADLRAVPPGRFQVLEVDKDDADQGVRRGERPDASRRGGASTSSPRPRRSRATRRSS